MRIAIIGPGMMGSQHAQCVRDSSRLKLAGVVHPLGESFQRPGFEDVHCDVSIERLVARTPIDGVVIASPNNLHSVHMKSCSRLQLPMLVEKPMVHKKDEAAQVLSDLEVSKVPVLVGHHRLHSPIICAAKSVLDTGRLGELVCVRGSAKYMKPASYFTEKPWRIGAGGGPLFINFVHDIASMLFLLGSVDTVQSFVSNSRRQRSVEDTAVVNLAFKSGVLGSFVISDCAVSGESWERTSGENPFFPNGPDHNCYEITGTDGSLQLPTLDIVHPRSGKSATWENTYVRSATKVHRSDPLKVQLDHFADVIAEGTRPIVSARFGCEVIAVMEAITRSANSGDATEVSMPKM